MSEKKEDKKKEDKKEERGIKTWAAEDRPREKLILKGRAALSDAELLAILIGSGSSSLSAVDVGKALLKSANYDLNNLARFGLKEFMKIPGIGTARAVAIMSALELGRRRRGADHKEKPKITSPEAAYRCLMPEMLDLPHEEFWIILLNQAKRLLKKQLISRGGIAGTVADPKIIFAAALEGKASSIIAAHNHPSGNLKPSVQDKILTKRLVEGGKVLALPLVDHLIFTDGGYFSFSEEGLIPI